MAAPRSVVFLNRFYWPDVAATGQMLTDLAEDLAADGWDVTVVTSRIGYDDVAARPPARETRNGVRIVRVVGTRFGRQWLPGRLADSATYLAGAFLRLLRLPRPDRIVAMTDPPFLVAVALAAGRLRRVPVVYWLQDLFPQIAVRLGVLRERSLAGRGAAALARRLNRACDAVVTLGPRMTEAAVRAGARAERTAHTDNWADAEAVRPVEPDANPALDELGLRGRFVVLYSGNAGRAHAFEAVLEAARRLREDDGVVFQFIGGGTKLPAIRAATEAERLGNVRFAPYVPRERLGPILSCASVSLVTEDPAVVGHVVPSKTYGILASGRPLVFVGSAASDVAAIVRRHRCGVVVDPGDPDGLVGAIERLRADPAEAAAMGARGRRAAETLYDRRVATRRWRETVEGLLAESRAAEPSREREAV